MRTWIVSECHGGRRCGRAHRTAAEPLQRVEPRIESARERTAEEVAARAHLRARGGRQREPPRVEPRAVLEQPPMPRCELALVEALQGVLPAPPPSPKRLHPPPPPVDSAA